MKRMQHSPEWTQPEIYDVANEAELDELGRDLGIDEVYDPIATLAEDIYKYRHPDAADDEVAKKRYIDSILAEGPSFGKWVRFDWRNPRLVHTLDPDDHYDLRTASNRNLITTSQQRRLRVPVSVIGLSVGSNAAIRAVQEGIGSHYDLIDFDEVSLPNTNRIDAGAADIGMLKTTFVGRQIAERDPFLSQTHHTSGYNRDTEAYLRANPPRIIIEETDDPTVKVRVRELAEEIAREQQREITLIMGGDADDIAILDIEQYGQQGTQPFGGRLTRDQMRALAEGNMTDTQKTGAFVQMLGPENISGRLFESAALKGRELSGLPQFGSTSATVGALVTVAMRRSILEKDLPSSRKVVDIAGGYVPAKPGV